MQSPPDERIPTVSASTIAVVVFLWSMIRFEDLLMILPIAWNLAAFTNDKLRGKVI